MEKESSLHQSHQTFSLEFVAHPSLQIEVRVIPDPTIWAFRVCPNITVTDALTHLRLPLRCHLWIVTCHRVGAFLVVPWIVSLIRPSIKNPNIQRTASLTCASGATGLSDRNCAHSLKSLSI